MRERCDICLSANEGVAGAHVANKCGVMCGQSNGNGGGGGGNFVVVPGVCYNCQLPAPGSSELKMGNLLGEGLCNRWQMVDGRSVGCSERPWRYFVSVFRHWAARQVLLADEQQQQRAMTERDAAIAKRLEQTMCARMMGNKQVKERLRQARAANSRAAAAAAGIGKAAGSETDFVRQLCEAPELVLWSAWRKSDGAVQDAAVLTAGGVLLVELARWAKEA